MNGEKITTFIVNFNRKIWFFFDVTDRITHMQNLHQPAIESEQISARIPAEIAGQWNIWYKNHSLLALDTSLSKGNFASAAFLFFMESAKKNIDHFLKKTSVKNGTSKQVSTKIPKKIADQWLAWCEQYDKNDDINKGNFMAAAFAMLMSTKDDIVSKYIEKTLCDKIKTSEIAARIPKRVADRWDQWCNVNIVHFDLSKGTLASTALSIFMDSKEKLIWEYIEKVLNHDDETKNIHAIIPNYINLKWVCETGKIAFKKLKNENIVISKGTFLASALLMLMDSKDNEIAKYIKKTYSKDNYTFEVIADDEQEMIELFAFALSGKLF